MNKNTTLLIFLLATTLSFIGCDDHRIASKQEIPSVQEFHKAAESGDLNRVKNILAAGVDVNAEVAGRVALHCAVDRGHKEIASFLCERGANVNAAEWLGNTPLNIASTIGNVELVELLLSRGANVRGNPQHLGVVTPLYSAARFGHKEVAKVLLDHGAKADEKVGDWPTPREIAQKMGHTEIVALMGQGDGQPSNASDSGKASGLSTASSLLAIPAVQGPVTFTRSSNGYDWRRADSESRRKFCETISAAMNKQFNQQFTWRFFYGALDTFYDTPDTKLLGQNIHEIVALTTSAAIK